MGERLAAVVRRLRLRAGLTQEELAERAGISVRTIRRLETGQRRNPRLSSVLQLAAALGLQPTEHDDLMSAALESMSLPSSRPKAGSSVVPRQLPAVHGRFVGRAAELADLTESLAASTGDNTTVVINAIGGAGGIGKTALALHWAHHNADQFPDGQLYVNLRGFDPTGSPVAPADAIHGFLDAFGITPDRIPPSLNAQASLYRSLLANRRMLVVLDNARDAEQVRPLLPGSGHCLVLVTSRHQLTSLVTTEGAHLIAVDLLTVGESRELLALRLGPDRVAAEPDATDDLLAQCAGLPLALAITAARAAANPHFPLAALANELQNSGARLNALNAGDTMTEIPSLPG